MNASLLIKGIDGVIPGGISIKDFAVITRMDENKAKEILDILIQNEIGEINDEPSAHYEKWEKLRENIYEIGDIEGSRYMEIADENEYNAFKQSYENHPDFGEEYTNFLNKFLLYS